MILATSMANAATFSWDETIASVDEVQATNPAAGYLFWGTIGGDDGCSLEMPYGNRAGSYTFLNYTRITRFGSYNPKTRSLVINAYEVGTGKYIGKFVGKLTKDRDGFFQYRGVFTNYKGGKVNFNLMEGD